MIVQYGRPGQPTLVDQEALSRLTGRSIRTIRRHCKPVRHRGQRPLYDLEASVTTLAEIPQRRRVVAPPPATPPDPAGGSTRPDPAGISSAS